MIIVVTIPTKKPPAPITNPNVMASIIGAFANLPNHELPLDRFP